MVFFSRTIPTGRWSPPATRTDEDRRGEREGWSQPEGWESPPVGCWLLAGVHLDRNHGEAFMKELNGVLP